MNDNPDSWRKSLERPDIDLMNPAKCQMFLKALVLVEKKYGDLDDYNRRFFDDMRCGWQLAGTAMTLTFKQFEHLRGLVHDA